MTQRIRSATMMNAKTQMKPRSSRRSSAGECRQRIASRTGAAANAMTCGQQGQLADAVVPGERRRIGEPRRVRSRRSRQRPLPQLRDQPQPRPGGDAIERPREDEQEVDDAAPQEQVNRGRAEH